MEPKTDYIQKTLQIASWIIFIGLCVEAGAFIFNTFFTLFINTTGAKKFWMEIDLSGLHHFSESMFVTITSQMIIVAVLKALMFYLIVRSFVEKKINISKPFNETIKKLILNTAYLALGIGIFSLWGAKLTTSVMKQGVNMPGLQELKLGGGDVWLFMAVILLVIAQIFKKGIEIQSENELTV